MKFVQGVFQKFISPADLAMGDLNMTLTRGAIVEFDGTNMVWGGQTFLYPKLALGIAAGWVVPYTDGEEVPRHKPKPAGVEVRAAESQGNERGDLLNVEMAVEDEQVAGTLKAANAKREASRTATPSGAPPAVDVTPDMGVSHAAVDATPPGMGRQDSDVVNVTPPPGSIDAPDSVALAPAKKRFPIAGGAEDQGGVTVATVGSAKHKTVLSDSGQAQREAAAIDKRGPVKVVKVAAAPVDDIVLEEPVVVPEPVVAAEPAPAPVDEDEFVWDIKGLHWQKRIKLAIEKYGDNPALFQKVMDLETPGVVKALRSWQSRKSASASV